MVLLCVKLVRFMTKLL